MLEHSPETTGLLDTTLPFHWLTFFQAVASHPLSANLEETFLTPSDQRQAASSEAQEKMKSQAAPGHMISMSQHMSPCHLPRHDTRNSGGPFSLRTLCRVVAGTSSSPPHVGIVLLLLVCFWYLFPTEEHLRWQSACPFNTKAEKEILSSGSSHRGRIRRRKRLGFKSGRVDETLDELFWPLLLLFYIKCTFHSKYCFYVRVGEGGIHFSMGNVWRERLLKIVSSRLRILDAWCGRRGLQVAAHYTHITLGLMFSSAGKFLWPGETSAAKQQK